MLNPVAYPVLSNVPIRTIEREELRQKLARGDQIKLVMCLNEFAFRAKHIPGSVHFNTPDEMMDGLQKDDEIILYCGGGFRSALAAEALQKMGYTNVASMDGGIRAWRAQGLPEDK